MTQVCYQPICTVGNWTVITLGNSRASVVHELNYPRTWQGVGGFIHQSFVFIEVYGSCTGEACSIFSKPGVHLAGKVGPGSLRKPSEKGWRFQKAGHMHCSGLGDEM